MGLEPGHGKLTIGALLDPRAISAAARYSHRLTEDVAAFAEGRAVYGFETRQFAGQAMVGLEARF
jgi:hypothetical protein